MDYKYRVINDKYFLFENQVPFGPVQLLHNSIHALVSYFDYDDKIKVVYKPLENGTARLAFFSVPGANEFWQMLHVVSLLNAVAANISIYCSGKCLSALQQYTNPHIRLHDIDAISGNAIIEANAVISFSPAAIYFIKQKIPVIIAGPMGIGGLVSPENFHHLSEAGFWGRPGGSAWENLPYKIFMHEWQSIKNQEEITQMTEACAILANNLSWFPAGSTGEVETQLNRQAGNIYSLSERGKITPSIAPDILFVYDNAQHIITRKPLNQVLGTTEDTGFFQLFNGKNDLAEICTLSGMETEEFWETITGLVRKKIIIY